MYRAAFLYTPQPELTFVLGTLLWDRLNEKVLPWAGVIYRPSQYWQFDLVFPQFRIATATCWDELGIRRRPVRTTRIPFRSLRNL